MKKSTKLAVSLLASLVAVSGVSAIPATNNVVDTRPDNVFSIYNKNEPHIRYDFLPEDEMPILGYIGVVGAGAGNAGNEAVNPSFVNKANFQRYKDAGFNILSGLYEKESLQTPNPDVHKSMDLCAEMGLTYFVCDNNFRCGEDYTVETPMTTQQALEIMQQKWYLNEPAFGGIAVKDEPEWTNFAQMGSVSEALKQLTDGKVVYTNLFPQYASSNQLGYNGGTSSSWTEYDDYVTKFMEIVQPDILAYDYYVFMRKGATLANASGSSNIINQGASEVNVDNYYRSLSYFRNMSKKYNTPFWVTVAAYNHRHGNHYTQKQTEWTVNTSLAYGAKGIQYYTYWATNVGGTTYEDWVNQNQKGLVSLNGTAHDTYYRVQKINQNIKTVDHVLMRATHKGVMQYGNQAIKLVPEDTLYGYGLLNNITGGDAFVGCFELDGKQVYYIVNNSINAGVQTLKADFVDKVNVRLTNLNGVSTYSNTYSVGFNLSGGEAILLEVL